MEIIIEFEGLIGRFIVSKTSLHPQDEDAKAIFEITGHKPARSIAKYWRRNPRPTSVLIDSAMFSVIDVNHI